MPSERVQRQIDRLLDQCEETIAQRDWAAARELAESVLRMDPGNEDAVAYMAAAGPSGAPPGGAPAAAAEGAPARAQASPADQPTSFCDGRYEVKRFLGEGGKKLVYLAHDTKLDRDVAFSLIKTDGLDAEGEARIRREAQAMGRLGDHPHIVSVFDIGEEPHSTGSGQGGQPYLVSQLMGGGDVAELIEKAENHRVPVADAVRIAEEVCRALEHAHGQGIVHRDLKPGNVWLTG